jgi:hypothetical protein
MVVALLITGLVRFLVFVPLEVVLLGVILLMCKVRMTLAHTLLVISVLGVIRVLSPDRASRNAHTHYYCRNPQTTS